MIAAVWVLILSLVLATSADAACAWVLWEQAKVITLSPSALPFLQTASAQREGAFGEQCDRAAQQRAQQQATVHKTSPAKTAIDDMNGVLSSIGAGRRASGVVAILALKE